MPRRKDHDTRILVVELNPERILIYHHTDFDEIEAFVLTNSTDDGMSYRSYSKNLDDAANLWTKEPKYFT